MRPGVLVDLVGFEPTTSSMPFKKYQSLTDTATRNKRLSAREFGRRWTPRGGFGGVWTPRGLQDSTPESAPGVLSRARLQAIVIVVCWRRQHLFLIRMMPTQCSGGVEAVIARCGAEDADNVPCPASG